MIIIDRIIYKQVKGFQLVIGSLHISPQENAAVIGPSGSGKTTLLRLIAGLDIPDKGNITINGKVVTIQPPVPPHLRGISLLSQNFGLWGHLTVSQHLAFARSKGKTLETDTGDHELLKQVQLDEKADVGIDIQQMTEKILRIKHKFASPIELDYVEDNLSNEMLILIWCAKEALFKRMKIAGLIFKEEIAIEPFEMSNSGVLKARVNHKQIQRDILLNYEILNDYTLVYTINP